MKTFLIYDNESETNELVALFRTHQRVMYICSGNYFKITMDDHKFFLFDATRYSYEEHTGKVVKIVNEL